jgi:hypothetical protein
MFEVHVQNKHHLLQLHSALNKNQGILLYRSHHLLDHECRIYLKNFEEPKIKDYWYFSF